MVMSTQTAPLLTLSARLPVPMTGLPYPGVSKGLDGGCAGAVVEDRQFSKHLSWAHCSTQLPTLRHLHFSIWAGMGAQTSTIWLNTGHYKLQ